jgi:hypothetical protein
MKVSKVAGNVGRQMDYEMNPSNNAAEQLEGIIGELCIDIAQLVSKDTNHRHTSLCSALNKKGEIPTTTHIYKQRQQKCLSSRLSKPYHCLHTKIHATAECKV